MSLRSSSHRGFGRFVRGVLVLVLVSSIGSLAFAQSGQVGATAGDAQSSGTTTVDSEPTPVTPQEWFRRGENVYRIGRYEEAIDAWERAYSLDPRPRIQYNLAQAYERMGRLEDAVAALESYVREGQATDVVYADANARLAELRQRVASTGVIISGGPSGGAITVDGTSWGVTPRPDRIALSPGSHEIEIRYPDQRIFRATVATPAGQLVPVAITDANLQSPEVQLVETERAPSRAMLFAGIGTAAVGVGLLSYGIERQVRVGRCEEPGNYCENIDAGRAQRTVGLLTGSLLTAGGAAMIVVDLLRQRSYRARHAEDTALECAPLFPGATCRLRF